MGTERTWTLRELREAHRRAQLVVDDCYGAGRVMPAMSVRDGRQMFFNELIASAEAMPRPEQAMVETSKRVVDGLIARCGSVEEVLRAATLEV